MSCLCLRRLHNATATIRMGLFSFFKRPAPGATPSAGASLDVDAARTRARRRLIGAVLLLGIGVIAFPILFETQPRPIPVDLPIEIPRKEGAPPLSLPAARAPASAAAVTPPASPAVMVTETKADAGKEIAAPADAGAPVAVNADPALRSPPAAPPKPVAASAPRPVPAKTPTPAPALQTKGEAPASAAVAGRFVVQVGAFADAALAREARAKVEKLGLRTYTQVLETDGGKRIRVRVGPFESRDEAEQSAAKIKAAGLTAAVLTL
jgi:DedD protein